MNRYAIGQEIGEGAFGKVFFSTKKSTGEKRAIKILKGSFSWEEMIDMRELKSIMEVSLHPNIVRLFEVHHNKRYCSVSFVFEYMQGGSLYDLLCRREEQKLGPLREQEIRSIIRQVLLGLNHIHKAGHMHRDLKPENILLSGCGTVAKVADFTLARYCHGTSASTSYVATRWYRAPEILLAAPNYNTPVDLFAIGCIMAELYRLTPLFPGKNEIDQLHLIFQLMGPLTQDVWPDGLQLMERHFGLSCQKHFHSLPTDVLVGRATPNASKLSIDLLVGLLTLHPQKRLSTTQALSHPFFITSPAAHKEEEKIATATSVDSSTSTSLVNYSKKNGVPLNVGGLEHGSSASSGSENCSSRSSSSSTTTSATTTTTTTPASAMITPVVTKGQTPRAVTTSPMIVTHRKRQPLSGIQKKEMNSHLWLSKCARTTKNDKRDWQ